MATILIVDDVRENRVSLAATLRTGGYSVIEARDGSAGLAAARLKVPDLVITDVLMPVMDGYEFVRRLRREPATSATPVLFYTAPYGEREARILARSHGMADVLTKPPIPAKVLAIVTQVLSGGPVPAAGDSADAQEAQGNHLRLLTDSLARTKGDLRATNARLRALINIGLDLAFKSDPVQLLREACGAVCDLFGASYTTVGMVDPGSATIAQFVSCGVGDGAWPKVGDSVPEMFQPVISQRRSLRGHNPGGDPALLQLPAGHPEVHAYLAAPIGSVTHVYGWILLVRNESQDFTAEDEMLVLALCSQIGRAYEHDGEMSDRKEAELALRSERDRSQRYLDTAQVILLALDMRGCITLANRYACDVLGWLADDLIGRDFVETCTPVRLRTWTRLKLREVLAGPESSVVLNPVITKSGEERLIEWRNTLLCGDDGVVQGTLSSGTDRTDRDQAQVALRTANERTQFALTAAGVGVWDMDFVTGKLEWSEILEGQYGLAPGAFNGTFEGFIACVHPDDRAGLLEIIGAANQTGSDFTLQHRALWPDGTVRWLNGAGRVQLDATGGAVRGVGISLDVTARRKLEEQSYHAQKMEAIGRLAGGIAHDFNNLLTAILGYCQLLQEDFEPGDARAADVAEIFKAGTSAARLTRQLLTFSRQQIVQPQLLDINVVVTDMRAMLARVIGEDIEIRLHLRAAATGLVADQGQIEQIVMNLAVNARDAMPDGGTLTIETADVDFDEKYAGAHGDVLPGSYVVMTVTDTGRGIPLELQSRVFEPFFTTKELGHGTGLGLATVHGIVTRSGGGVTLYSEIGHGTSFSVYLPRGVAAAAVEKDVALPLAPATETVLLVEDDDALRQLTRRLLERRGYTVVEAANVGEAVAAFSANCIDVLLTDVVMPGGSGRELATTLRQQRPELKVIYMSGYTEDTISRHGVLHAGIAFLQKPYTATGLERKLHEVLTAAS